MKARILWGTLRSLH